MSVIGVAICKRNKYYNEYFLVLQKDKQTHF